MKYLKIVFKCSLIILVLFSIQTITFLTLGDSQLKDKLLSDSLLPQSFQTDTVFVRDWYLSDCNVGETLVYEHTLNLKRYPEYLKQKIKAKEIEFSEASTFTWNDTAEKKFKLLYVTNARSEGLSSLYGGYRCLLEEHLSRQQSGKNLLISRKACYRWVFFFWIEESVVTESWSNPVSDF